jgi:uncharacterized protein (DUF983 family)
MPAAANPTRMHAILHGLCPRCRRGKIFSRSLLAGLPKMNEVCPSCGLKYEREHGYFLGALYISYMMAVPVMALLVVIFWLTTNWRIEKLIIAAAIGLIPFAPFLTIFARVLWLHFARAMDPD